MDAALQYRSNMLSRLAQTPPAGAAPSSNAIFTQADVMSDVGESAVIGGLGGALAGVVAAMLMKNPGTILFGFIGAAVGAAAYGGWTYSQDMSFMTPAGGTPSASNPSSPTGM